MNQINQAIFNMIKKTPSGKVISLILPMQGVGDIQKSQWCQMIGVVVGIKHWEKCDIGDEEPVNMVTYNIRVPDPPKGYEEDMERCNYKLDDSWFRYYGGQEKWAGLRERYNYIINSVERGPVLDIGCGPGVVCVELRKKGFIVTGLDYSDKMIRIASARGGEYVWGKAENLPFEDNSFETVIMTQVLEHVVNLEKSISEADRVARKNSKIIISVPDRVTSNRFHLRTFDKESLLNALPLHWQVMECEVVDERIRAICKRNWPE